jgi:hypothetical protein
MDTLKDIINDLRVFFYGGIATLPLTLAGTMLLLGLFTANYALLFFLVGFLILVPIAHALWNLLFTAILPASYLTLSKDICHLIIPFLSSTTPSSEYMATSQWTSMISFFFGYMLTNAIILFQKEQSPMGEVEVTEEITKMLEQKTSYRKTQAMVSVLSIIIVALFLFISRYRTGCESMVAFLAIPVFMAMGAGWYLALHSFHEGCLSDLFGIANRLLPPNAIVNRPVACIPVPA